MAKNTAEAKKAKDAAKNIKPAQTGKLGKKPITLKYNAGTKRYDMEQDDRLLLSHLSHVACLSVAEQMGVAWDKSAKDGDKTAE